MSIFGSDSKKTSNYTYNISDTSQTVAAGDGSTVFAARGDVNYTDMSPEVAKVALQTASQMAGIASDGLTNNLSLLTAFGKDLAQDALAINERATKNAMDFAAGSVSGGLVQAGTDIVKYIVLGAGLISLALTLKR